jgi:hypothetical protein
MNTIDFDISVDTDLTSPDQLESFLRKLKELLRAGALTHARPQGTLVTSVDFDQLNESGPWPDVIDEEFVDAQGRRFHLFVDSYHGAGGKWASSDTD